MSKQAAPNAGDHWRRLAAELGLEMEAPPPEQPESAPIPEPISTRRDEPVQDFIPSADSGIWTADTHTIDILGENETAPPSETSVAEYDRGEPEPAEVADATDETGEGDKPRRRRRRSRRKKSDGAAVEVAATAEESSMPSDDEDSPADVVKDWDIPSWNDLIASLYRPDR